MGLGRAPVKLDQALDRAFEVLRVEAVERLRRDRCRVQHLLGEANEQRAVAGLRQRVRDRQVRDRRREQHRPVGLLRPQVAEDIARRLRVLEVVDEPDDALARPAVDLADVEGAPATEEDPAGADDVGAEVDERSHRAVRADGLGDGGLVDPVLERDDVAVVGEACSYHG